MKIVDAHCHTTPVWYEPVESLLFQMDRNDVEKAVLIQIMGNYDNEYQFDCVAKHPDRPTPRRAERTRRGPSCHRAPSV